MRAFSFLALLFASGLAHAAEAKPAFELDLRSRLFKVRTGKVLSKIPLPEIAEIKPIEEWKLVSTCLNRAAITADDVHHVLFVYDPASQARSLTRVAYPEDFIPQDGQSGAWGFEFSRDCRFLVGTISDYGNFKYDLEKHRFIDVKK